jgi:hypothetical protein
MVREPCLYLQVWCSLTVWYMVAWRIASIASRRHVRASRTSKRCFFAAAGHRLSAEEIT